MLGVLRKGFGGDKEDSVKRSIAKQGIGFPNGTAIV